MPIPRLKPEAHVLIQFMLDRCNYPRSEVAKRIGITRKTLYEWEYQLTNVRDGMVDKVSIAAEYPLERIPNSVKDNALLADAKRRKQKATRNDLKRGIAAEQPPSHNKDVYAESVAAEARRAAEREARAKDPKRKRILNYGKPTAVNNNPKTFASMTMNHTRIRGEGNDIPTDEELPDMATIALKGLPPYELVYVEGYRIPYVTSETGTMGMLRGWYFKDANGKEWCDVEQKAATIKAGLRRAADIKAAEDLI